MPYCLQSEIRNAHMALKYLLLAILVLIKDLVSGDDILNNTDNVPIPGKAILDPKRRNDLVDEAFLEQKDILLDMLEAKLKEVRDKKKKKSDQVENNSITTDTNCKLQTKNVDLNLKANGIVSVGEANVQLKFGKTGESALNLNATGISNVGKAYLNLGIDNGTVHIPGLDNLFSGTSILKSSCDKEMNIDEKENSQDNINLDDIQSRRSINVNSELKKDNESTSTNSTTPEKINTTEKITTMGSLRTDFEDKDYK